MPKKTKSKIKPKTKAKTKAKLKTKSKVNKRSVKKAISSYIPRPMPDVVSKKISKDTLSLLKLDNDHNFFQISGISAKLWLMLDGKTSLEAIKARLRKDHRLPKSFDTYADEIIGALKKEKLVE